MGDARWDHRGAITFLLGGWLLASCTLVDRYGLGTGDAGPGNDTAEPGSEFDGGDVRSGTRVDAAGQSSGPRPRPGLDPERDAAAEEAGPSTPGERAGAVPARAASASTTAASGS